MKQATQPSTWVRRDLSRPRRVLLTFDSVGGVWRFALSLARPLASLGYEPLLAGLGPKPTREQLKEADPSTSIVWTDLPLDWMAQSESELARVGPELAALARKHNCELLHVNVPSQAVGVDAGMPVVAMTHSCVATWWKTMRGAALPQDMSWQGKINLEGMRRADAVVAPSHAHARMTAETYGLGSVGTIHNGIDLFVPPARREAFVFAAGRWWDEGKGGAVMDAAAADSPWPVRIAGSCRHPDGGEFAFAHASHLGVLSHASLLEHVRRAGIVVSPSLYEPFGLAALEGARSGAPLILSDIPVYRELWDGAAIFVPAGDGRALGETIARLSMDGRQRDALGCAARNRSARYTAHRQAEQLAGIWSAVSTRLGKGNPRVREEFVT